MTGPAAPITPYALDDPTVARLAKFIERMQLSNGQLAPIPAPLSQLVAQAITNYTQGLVWDPVRSGYMSLAEWQSEPELGDIALENIAGTVTRITHRVTGITVLGETPDDAWRQLRQKVKAARGH